MLGYRDSGMMGTDANGHPESFWQADIDAATQRLVEIVREARPAAIVSYDENGNYGHPDHINAARIAREAYQASQGADWAVDRFYEIAWHRDAWFGLMADMRERGIELPWDMDAATEPPPPDQLNPSNVAAIGQVAETLEDDTGATWEDSFGRADEEITTRIDVSAHVAAKRASMDCHRTQRQDLGWLLELPDDLADRALSTEYLVLRWRGGEDAPPSHREAWLLPV
jgi:N-acetyl-1-D-myo-inositol-2-amino-2-deoxy-alpha-D-glucopyranoside deacetylase